MFMKIVKSRGLEMKPDSAGAAPGLPHGGDKVWAFSRATLKAALLGGRVFLPVGRGADITEGVILSECDECGNLAARVHGCERGLKTIEEKLDRLLELQLGGQCTPKWAELSERRMIAAVRNVTAEIGALATEDLELKNEQDRLRTELGELADGADRFLAGLQGKLGDRDSRLFFELISTTSVDGTRKVKSYAEIARRTGITRQAVQKRYKQVCSRFPDVGRFVSAIRHPRKPQNFSEMSPSARRKEGVDETYNYDADS